MRTHPYLKVIAVVCIGALASCAPKPIITKIPMSVSLRPDSSLSGRVFTEVNSYRRSHGTVDLQRHAGLDRLAQEHCEYLRQHRGSFGLYGKNVSHFGFEGRALLARERYQMMNVSENVAASTHAGSSPAQTMVKLWSQSKAHEHNMRSSWTHTGVGAVMDSDGTIISTQLFATISYSQLATRDRFNRF
jgi:uncharacterized protein YkwD